MTWPERISSSTASWVMVKFFVNKSLLSTLYTRIFVVPSDRRHLYEKSTVLLNFWNIEAKRMPQLRSTNFNYQWFLTDPWLIFHLDIDFFQLFWLNWVFVHSLNSFSKKAPKMFLRNLTVTKKEPRRNLEGTSKEPWRNLKGTSKEPWRNLEGTLNEPRTNFEWTSNKPWWNVLERPSKKPWRNLEGTLEQPCGNHEGTSKEPQWNLKGKLREPRRNHHGTFLKVVSSHVVLNANYRFADFSMTIYRKLQ